MNRSLVVLAVLPFVAGCNGHTKNPASGDKNVTINSDEHGHVAFNLPFMSGSVKLPEGAMHDANFDIDGVKMIPGGTITGFNVDAGDKGSLVDLAFKAPAAPAEVRAYFLDQFKAKGVDAAAAGDAISGKSKDGSPFTIDVSPDPNGSRGKIVIQDTH
jgi:hypothetical protein